MATTKGRSLKRREPVNWFSREMEANLREKERVHTDRTSTGWRGESPSWLFVRMVSEMTELAVELERLRSGSGRPQAIISECADVANCAMMIADKARREAHCD